MQTESFIWESDRDGGLTVNITPGRGDSRTLSMEILSPVNEDRIAITIFTDDRAGFLELVRKVAHECLLRVKEDSEQEGEQNENNA